MSDESSEAARSGCAGQSGLACRDGLKRSSCKRKQKVRGGQRLRPSHAGHMGECVPPRENYPYTVVRGTWSGVAGTCKTPHLKNWSTSDMESCISDAVSPQSEEVSSASLSSILTRSKPPLPRGEDIPIGERLAWRDKAGDKYNQTNQAGDQR